MLRFGVLGPLTVSGPDGPIKVSGGKQRRLLGVLLRHAGEPVARDMLIDALWDGRPPQSASDNLRVYLHHLRRALGDDGRLLRRDHGAVGIHPDELDARQFERLTEEARLAGSAQETSRAFEAALALWRGQAFGEVADLPAIRDEAIRLTELRLAALEGRIDADLQLARHAELVAELTSLVSEHPLRERLRIQLMTALNRAGRRSDALRVYAEGRQVLAKELGIEPSRELQDLHRAILVDDDSPPDLPARQAPPPIVPAELPGDIDAFTGRAAEIVRLREQLTGEPRGSGALVIAAIAGPGGVGKSALAIHAGHLAADRFPDGQIYIDLHGSTPDTGPVDPQDALARMLRSLGHDTTALPGDIEQAAAHFRSATDGRRLLIVLDNAHDAAQVRPLLPGSPACAILITSRRMLTSLDGATHHRLDVLTEDEAGDLLSRLAGPDRVAAERAAAAEVVRHCGRLPLALCIAAGRLTARPHWTIRELADRLSTETHRLSELRVDNRAVRSSVAVSYRELDESGARMFRYLSLFDCNDVSVPVGSALAGCAEREAEEVLDDLTDVQLAESHAPGRYRLHDLLRAFARERVLVEDTEEARAQAVRRALHCHLATARVATLVLSPSSPLRAGIGPGHLSHPGIPLATREQVNAWIDAERHNLPVVIHQASRHDPAVAAGLAAALRFPVYHRGWWREQLLIAGVGVDAAERTGDIRDRALAQSDLARAHATTGATDAALRHFNASLDLWLRYGGPETVQQEAEILRGLAYVHNQRGEPDEALACSRRSIPLFRQVGSERGEVSALIAIGLCHLRQKDLAEALHAHREALEIVEQIDDPYWKTNVLGNLAEINRVKGDLDQAMMWFGRALELDRSAGYSTTYIHAEHLWGVGSTHHDGGDPERARAYWRQSATVLHTLGLIDEDERRTIESAARPPTPEVIIRNL